MVINTAGAFAAEIGKMVGLGIPIRPSRRHAFFMWPVNEIPKVSPMVVDFRIGFWFRREGAGLIFGMRNPVEPEGFNTKVGWDFLSAIGEVALCRLPLFEELGIAKGQVGLYSDNLDCHAIVEDVPEVRALYLACEFSGHGLMHTPAIDRLVVKLGLGEGEVSSDILPISWRRFKDGSRQQERMFV